MHVNDPDTNSSPWWDNLSLGDATVGLCVFTLPPHKPDQPIMPIMLAAAASKQGQVLVRFDQLAKFICLHHACELICYDAAKLHWALFDHFAQDPEATSALWQFAAEGRLIDVMLLDQLVRLANGGEVGDSALATQFNSISTLEQALFKQANKSSLPPTLQATVFRATAALLRAHRRLLKKVEVVAATQEHGLPDVDPSFGPLGLKIEVQGAIAIERARRQGLLIDFGVADQVIQKCDRVFKAARRQLLADPVARNCFKTDADKQGFKLDNGFLEPRRKKLRTWLSKLQLTIEGRNGVHLPGPALNNEWLPKPEEYGAMLDCNRSLRAWADCSWSSTVRHLLSSGAPEKCYPVYATVPRVLSAYPDLSIVRRLAPEGLFKATDRRQMLVGRFHELGLRALACVLELRTDSSKLADAYRSQRSPITEAARALCDVDDERFQRLPTEQRTAWIAIAKTVIEGITLRLGRTTLCEMVRIRTDHRIGIADVDLYVSTIRRVFPELELYLDDPTYSRLSQALGIPELECREKLRNVNDKLPTTEELFRWSLNMPGSDINLGMRIGVLKRNPALLGFSQIFTLVFEQPSGIHTGRLRHRAYPSERNAEHLDLADAAMKCVLFDLTRNGFYVRGFNGSDFAVEVRDTDDVDAACKRVQKLASSAAESILLGIPSPCACTTKERW